MSKNFYDVVKNRRSIYGLSKESPVSQEKIQEVIEHAINHVPSAFNSQSSRVVVLFGEQHDKLWDITLEELRKIVPPEAFGDTEARIRSFGAGYGTILFFEDQTVIEGLQAQFSLYKDNFPIWSLQSSGMLQYVVWASLHAEGLGASLQHYNPLIDEEVKKTWSIPEKWKLLGQMPMGKPVAEPNEKGFQPVEQRLKVFK